MPSAPGGRRSGPAAAVGPAAAAAVAAAVDVALAQVAAQPERLRAAGSGVREAPRLWAAGTWEGTPEPRARRHYTHLERAWSF